MVDVMKILIVFGFSLLKLCSDILRVNNCYLIHPDKQCFCQRNILCQAVILHPVVQFTVSF